MTGMTPNTSKVVTKLKLLRSFFIFCFGFFEITWVEGLMQIVSLPLQGRGNVCVHSTLLKPHLWKLVGYILLFDFVEMKKQQPKSNPIKQICSCNNKTSRSYFFYVGKKKLPFKSRCQLTPFPVKLL